jgi:hypothetical protein
MINNPTRSGACCATRTPLARISTTPRPLVKLDLVRETTNAQPLRGHVDTAGDSDGARAHPAVYRVDYVP